MNRNELIEALQKLPEDINFSVRIEGNATNCGEAVSLLRNDTDAIFVFRPSIEFTRDIVNPMIELRPVGGTREDIEKRANNFAKEHEFNLGDDIFDLVKKAGGRVDYSDGYPECSLEVRGPREFTITLVPWNVSTRDRMSVAYHLAQYALHCNQGQKLAHRIGRDTQRVLWETKVFSLELLMPRKEVLERYDPTGGLNWKLNSFFRVPDDAVRQRYEELTRKAAE